MTYVWASSTQNLWFIVKFTFFQYNTSLLICPWVKYALHIKLYPCFNCFTYFCFRCPYTACQGFFWRPIPIFITILTDWRLTHLYMPPRGYWQFLQQAFPWVLLPGCLIWFFWRAVSQLSSREGSTFSTFHCAELIILWSLCALVSSVASNSWKLEPLIKVAVCLLLEMADKIEKSRNLEELMNVMKVDLPGLSCSRLEDVIRQAGSLNITRLVFVYMLDVIIWSSWKQCDEVKCADLNRYTFSSMCSNEKVYLFKSAHFIFA